MRVKVRHGRVGVKVEVEVGYDTATIRRV